MERGLDPLILIAVSGRLGSALDPKPACRNGQRDHRKDPDQAAVPFRRDILDWVFCFLCGHTFVKATWRPEVKHERSGQKWRSKLPCQHVMESTDWEHLAQAVATSASFCRPAVVHFY